MLANYAICLSITQHLGFGRQELWCYKCKKWLGVQSSHRLEKNRIHTFIEGVLRPVLQCPGVKERFALNLQRQRARQKWRNKELLGHENFVVVSQGWVTRFEDFLVTPRHKAFGTHC